MSFQRTLLKWKIIGFYILEVFVFRVFCNNCCIKLWMHNFYMSLLLGHQLVIEFNAYKERLLEEIFDVCSARDRRKTISFVFHARVLGQYHLLSWLLNYYYAPCSRGGALSSGVLLKMEVGVHKGPWRRAWRYPAYLWSLMWVYAVKKTWRLVYGVYPRIPAIHHWH